ncbi:MAG: hypothetical protein KIY10_05095 [Thermoplasmata archaeon]|nr:hypothetical protein [Candidatus Sysuiplasma jiujiangense]
MTARFEKYGDADYGPVLVGLTIAAVLLFSYWYATEFIGYSGAGNADLPSVISAVVALLFWISVSLITFRYLFNNVLRRFVAIVRVKRWALLLFPGYLIIHLLIYGLVVENILVLTFGSPGFSNSSLGGFIVLGNAFFPHTLANALLQIALNPSLAVYIPPYFGLDWGPFSFYSAIVIGMLVTVHIERLGRLRQPLRRVGGSVVYPAAGVVGGASCCISLPVLLLTLSPLSSATLLVPMWVALAYALYFVLPISVIALLFSGLRHLGRR